MGVAWVEYAFLCDNQNLKIPFSKKFDIMKNKSVKYTGWYKMFSTAFNSQSDEYFYWKMGNGHFDPHYIHLTYTTDLWRSQKRCDTTSLKKLKEQRGWEFSSIQRWKKIILYSLCDTFITFQLFLNYPFFTA